jgi:1-deoxy-D-xylulose-5-phosphate reductoisomerase
MSERRDVVLLGSTGSIGTQAIDVVKRNPDRFRVVGLAAGGANPGLLAEQAALLQVQAVALGDADQLAAFTVLLEEHAGADHGIEVLAGPDAAAT